MHAGLTTYRPEWDGSSRAMCFAVGCIAPRLERAVKSISRIMGERQTVPSPVPRVVEFELSREVEAWPPYLNLLQDSLSHPTKR